MVFPKTKREWNVQVEQVILVDYENVQPQADELRCVDATRQLLKIFHGPGQNSLPIRVAAALLPIGPVVELIQCEKPGKDALDFHLAFHLGRLSVEYPSAQFVIVSRDRKGFAQLVEHGVRLGCRMTMLPSLLEAVARPELDSGRVLGRACSETEAAGSVTCAVTLSPAPQGLQSAVAKGPASDANAPPPGPAVDPKSTAATAPAGKPASKKAPAKRAAAKEVVATKTPAKKAAAKTVATKKVAAKKAAGPSETVRTAAKAPAKKTGTLPTPLAQTELLDAQDVPQTSATAAPPIAASATAKPQRDMPVPADISKAIALLNRVAVEKRPGKAAALQRHLESHLRAELSEAAVAELMRTLYAQGWIVDGVGGKLDYHLPRP